MTEIHRIPLLKDHHTHPSVYAAIKAGVSLRGISNKSEAIDLIRQRQESIVFVLGWDNSLFSFTRRELDSLPPVFICNTSLHAFLVNTACRDLLTASHPEVIRNIENSDWIEKNLPQILKLTVQVSGCQPEQLKTFYNDLIQKGVWYAEEMLLPNHEVLDGFQESGLSQRTAFWADPETFQELSVDNQRRIKGIKLFSDGALGAKTAAMSHPLITGETGLLVRSDNEFQQVLENLYIYEKPFAIHAIGDRAIDQVLEVVKAARARLSIFPPVRIEHSQFISKKAARQAKDLGIVLSMQPNFSPESVGYSDRLNQRQCEQNNRFRMLIDDIGYVPGKDLLFGSDGMPHGIESALQSSLFPPNSSQQLTLEEFTAGYCMPDETHGSIEIEVNHKDRTISIISIST